MPQTNSPTHGSKHILEHLFLSYLPYGTAVVPIQGGLGGTRTQLDAKMSLSTSRCQIKALQLGERRKTAYLGRCWYQRCYDAASSCLAISDGFMHANCRLKQECGVQNLHHLLLLASSSQNRAAITTLLQADCHLCGGVLACPRSRGRKTRQRKHENLILRELDT
jgi:hypothetical protein